MAFFPELLYQLNERDQQSTWLDPLLTRSTASTAATSVTATSAIVPLGRILVLQSCSAGGDGGGAQLCLRLAIGVTPPNQTTGFALASQISDPPAGFAQVRANWSGSVIVPAGWSLFATGTFNLGVAANSVNLDLAGIFLPVGNVQRV